MSGCLSGGTWRGHGLGGQKSSLGDVWDLLSDPHSLPASCTFPWLYLMVEKRGSKGFPLCKILHPRSTLGRLMGNFPRPLPFHKTSVPISPKQNKALGTELLHGQLVSGRGDAGAESLGMWELGSHHTTP